MRKRGYTVVELIVVIGIIAVVASILIPAASATRNRAYAAVCISNLHQLGLAMELYQADNGAYPSPLSRSFDDYIGHAHLACPLAPGNYNFGAYASLTWFTAKAADPSQQRYDDQLQKCFEKRGSEFPLVIDRHHLPRVEESGSTMDGFALVYRGSGAVNRVPAQRVVEIELAAAGSVPRADLPCRPGAVFGNL